MCRNRRIAMAMALLLAVSVTACGTSKNATITAKGEIPKEEYLNLDALSQSGNQETSGQYKVHTLELGTFTEAAMSQSMDREYINRETVYFDLPCDSAKFGEHLAYYGYYVGEGTPIATCYAETDDVELEEAQLQLQRLEERYAAAAVEYAEDLEEFRVDRLYEYNPYEQKVIDIQVSQRNLDWERTGSEYEKSIAAAQERVEELELLSGVIYINAPVSGFLVPVTMFGSGVTVFDSEVMSYIESMDGYYTATDRKTDVYSYGMEMAFKTLYGEVTGTVISADSKALYGNLDSHDVIFKLEPNDVVDQNALNGCDGASINGNSKVVNNVVLVPRAAVTVENDECFVTVLKEDGSLLKTEFIPGGSNEEYFWVFEGLTEGTQILMK